MEISAAWEKTVKVREITSPVSPHRYHRQFIEVATEYFLGDEALRRQLHSNLADYFLGKWAAGKEKPFHYPSYLVKKLVRAGLLFPD